MYIYFSDFNRNFAYKNIYIYIEFTGQSWLNLEKYIDDIYNSRFIKTDIDRALQQ